MKEKQVKWEYEIGQRIIDYNEDGSIRRDLTIIDRKFTKTKTGKYNHKYYKIKCNKCGFNSEKYWDVINKCYKEEYLVIEYDLTNGRNCPCCRLATRAIVNGINDLYTTNPELEKFFIDRKEMLKYSFGSDKKNKLKCPNCGFVKSVKISDLVNKGFCCPQCSDGISYPNKFMFNLLKQLNINFKNEYSPEWIDSKRYDFYLFDYNVIIEMDGGFHKTDNNMSGQTKEQSKEIDDYKDKLAKEHGLEVIRIDCDYGHNDKFNYIKDNIINSELSDILNLNNIDWNKISINSEKSMLVLVSKIRNETGLNATSISKKVGYSSTTVIEWLRKGNELKLCSYNGKEEIKKNNIKNSKEVKMYKDGKYIDTFKNSSDLQKISKERFGVLLYACEINRVCNNRKNSYKGYYFEFVNDKPIDEIKYKKGKQVEVFKEGVSLGIYESCNELSRKSLNDFGVEFLISQISNVCNGKRKSHKGYTFKYVK